MGKKKSAPKIIEQKYSHVPLLALAFGGSLCGFLLRLYMNLNCFEESRLLHRGCAVHTLLLILSLGVLAGFLWLSTGMGSDGGFRRNYSPFAPGAISCFLSAALLLAFSIANLRKEGDVFSHLVVYLGFPAVLCLVLLGLARLEGKPCPFSLSLGICIYLALRLVCQFRRWNSDPVIDDYCYALLASVASMLAAYHTAGFSLNQGARRRSLFYALAAIYFSAVSMADGGADCLFYSSVVFFMLGAMPRLRKPHIRRPGGQLIPKEPTA